MELIILLVLLYFFRNAFSEITDEDVGDYIVMDVIADGEFDEDLD